MNLDIIVPCDFQNILISLDKNIKCQGKSKIAYESDSKDWPY